jgi:uncharacterized phage-associated protein
MATKGSKAANILDVANYFIANADPGVVNEKVQKLCCYAQAFSLALRDQRLFDATVEAWRYGPVVKELCLQFGHHRRTQLSTKVRPGEDARRPFTYEQLFVLDAVNDLYGPYPPDQLSEMSHVDFPGVFDDSRAVITDDDIVAKFSQNEVIKAIQENFS